MARVLTGIQSTGVPHLGNLLGAIIPAIRLSESNQNECLFFIADFHSFTSIRNPNKLKENTYATAAAWLAFGFDTSKNIFYRQSDVTQVCELSWYLSCLAPYPMLANAHSFKDKSERLSDVNTGLFTYPVLMAADILLYDAEVVPVGKDQIQHIEITRDIAKAFNYNFKNSFTIPESKLDKIAMKVPGTDGNKMSKSHNNVINIFLPNKQLKKQIMSIKTDSTPLESPKDFKSCNIFNLYKLIANKKEVLALKLKYEKGNFGYGHAKKELFELICSNFGEQRDKFNFLMENKEILEEELQKGAEKAKKIADKVLNRVRKNIGY